MRPDDTDVNILSRFQYIFNFLRFLRFFKICFPQRLYI